MKLKYNGPAHVRSFTKADFTRHELEGGAAVTFEAKNNWIANVDDEVGEWLKANDREFVEATDEHLTTPDTARVGSPGIVKSANSEALLASSDDDQAEGPSPGAVETAGGAPASRSRATRSTRST